MSEDKNVREIWSDDELDYALAALNTEVPPGETALARARAELMTAAGDPEATTTHPKRHWGRWAVAIASVAALAIIAMVIPFGGSPAVSASAALTNAADKIGASDPPVGPGQYLYVETHDWSSMYAIGPGGPMSYLQEIVTQKWVPADQRDEWLIRSHLTGRRKWIQGSDEQLVSSGMDKLGQPDPERRGRCGDFYLEPGQQPCLQSGRWQNPTPEFLASLPSDPHALYNRLRTDSAGLGKDPDLSVLAFAADAIRTGLVPAHIRADIYRALALLPGLEVSDRSANLDGRIGIALGIDRAGERQEMIIDPANGLFIGERRTATGDSEGFPAGTVTGYSSISTGVVDNLGDKPGS